jgi:hypothetical protein
VTMACHGQLVRVSVSTTGSEGRSQCPVGTITGTASDALTYYYTFRRLATAARPLHGPPTQPQETCAQAVSEFSS